MQIFSVVLDSASNAYFANTIVNGYIIIRSDKPIKARSLDVSINGEAKASWIHQRGKAADKYSTVLYYIKTETLLWKCSDTSNKLPAGEYQFPFQFFIPHDAPPNFSTPFGDVRYWIDAEIDVPWGFNKTEKLEFSVCPFIDLNHDTRFAMPIIKKFQTIIPSKTVTMTIPKMGYVSGESIPLYVKIQNSLISDVKSVEMGVEAVYNFTAECINEYMFSSNEPMTKTISKFYTLHNVTAFPIESDYDVALTQNLCIPPLPPSFDHCGFIKIYYRVFVKLHTRKKSTVDPFIYLPIVIGTVPLKEVLNEVEPCAVGDDDYIQPPIPTSITSEFDLENVQFWEEESHRDLEEDNIYRYQPKYPFFLNLSSRLSF